MILHGHEDIVTALERDLPAVSLFTGPHSVGKWTVAEYFREREGILPTDLLRVHKLSADLSREVVKFAQTSAVGSKRMVIIQLDAARPQALNTLLKALEEPRGVIFFLIAEREVLPTIASRAKHFTFGRLTTEQVTRVLIEKKNFKADEAAKLAKMANGQINKAVNAAERLAPKALVLVAVRAFREHDPALLEEISDRWADEHTDMLATWCYEALIERPAVFTKEELDVSQIGKKVLLSILTELAGKTRAKLVVRGKLMGLLRGA